MQVSNCRWIAAAVVAFASRGELAAQGRLDGVLYVSDATDDRILRLVDLDGSGLIEQASPGEISIFYDDSSAGPDLSSVTHLASGPGGSLLALEGGTGDAVLRLTDSNHDGDANDDGEVTTFYDASAGGLKLSTPNTLIAGADGAYYVSDDSKTIRRILWIKDVDGDGDALDPEESRAVYDASALSLPVLEDVEALAFAPDKQLYAMDATLAKIFRLSDSNGDGDFLDENEVSSFFEGTAELVLADVESLLFSGTALYAASKKSGEIFRLEDRDGDGTASGAGEATLFLGAEAALRVAAPTDFLALPGGSFLVLDNTKDAVFGAQDANGDGDALDADEVIRWLVDDGTTLASPSGLAVGPRPVIVPGPQFIRGDSTGDGKLDISDPVMTLGYLFLGRTLPTCADALDSNDTGDLNISDSIFILNYLFNGGKSPPPPFPQAGPDPTNDPLSC